MRMRKKKWALPYIETRTDVVVFDPKENQGKWKSILGKDVLHLEIGAGKGSYWVNMATMYPEEGWVALEKSPDAIAMGLKKLEPANPNMRCIIGDAREIGEWFSKGEVDVLHLNFSDPWPKKAHAKRRLTSNSFRLLYQEILSEEGRILLKTDNADFFAYSVKEMNLDFDNVSIDEDFRSNPHPEDAITEYEQEFMDLGQPIYRGIWKVRK